MKVGTMTFGRIYKQLLTDINTSESSVSPRGLKVKEIPVKMHKREFGESSIKPLKSVYYMFSVCLSIIITSISAGGRK